MTQEMTFKKQARRLHAFLAGRQALGYADCLEAIAAVYGAANWRTLQGMATAETLGAAPGPAAQTNIWSWQFVDGESGRPVISAVLIQIHPKVKGKNYFYYRQLRHAFSDNEDAQDHLRRHVACQLAGEPTPPETVEFFAKYGDELVLDWGDEFESEGLTLAELAGMRQVDPDMWQLEDGRKLKFAYTRTVGSPETASTLTGVAQDAVKKVYVGNRAITPLMEAIVAEHLGGSFWNEHPTYPRSDWAEEAMNGDTWQSYPIWLLVKLEMDAADEAGSEKPRYLVSEGWGHLFGPGNHETIVRFVFDRAESRIIFMEYLEAGHWHAASSSNIAEVQDSLLNANSEALTTPDDYGCTNSDALPEWAQVK